VSGDGLSNLITKACFLAAITAIIILAGNTESSLAFKHIKDSLLRHGHHQ